MFLFILFGFYMLCEYIYLFIGIGLFLIVASLWLFSCPELDI